MSPNPLRRRRLFYRFGPALVILCSLVRDSTRLQAAEDLRNELPAPANFQATVLKNSIRLSWVWKRPEELPVFVWFGYEVKRQDGKTVRIQTSTYEDAKLFPGSYAYRVRVRGESKEKRKRIVYVSDWAGPVSGVIHASCPRSPTVELTVEPTQKKYGAISSLRFHLKGQVSVDSGCTLGTVSYRLDTGTGILHNGPLKLGADGSFDTFVNAFGPEDEIPSGQASFVITVTADDEAGPTTSAAYTIDVQLENPYAPHPE